MVHIIESGLVKLVHVTASGREVGIGLRSEGWYGGAASVLVQAPNIYSAYTITPCSIVCIPAREFSGVLSRSPEMLAHFMKALCLEVNVQARLQVELSHSAEDRLEHFMRERNDIHSPWKTIDPLPALKQMELAQLLSISPEHLSRLLQKRRPSAKRDSRAQAA